MLPEDEGQPNDPELSEPAEDGVDSYSDMLIPPFGPRRRDFPLTGTKFWVIGGDSRRYGPTDREGLFEWFEDGRVAPDMMVADDMNGRVIARRIFAFAEDPAPEPLEIEAPPAPPPVLKEWETGFDAHFKLGSHARADEIPGMPEYLGARCLAVVAFVMAIFFPPVGVILQPFAIVLAGKAIKKGITEAVIPRTIAIIGFGVSVVLLLLTLASLSQLF